MGFVAVYDACVLYPSTLRDLLIRIAQAGLVQAKWTDTILNEVFRSLQEKPAGPARRPPGAHARTHDGSHPRRAGGRL
jgi:hypothetical protein